MDDNIRIEITEAAFKQFPVGKFVRFERTQDMDMVKRDCVIWEFEDANNHAEVRRAYFCTETGEYLGEAMDNNFDRFPQPKVLSLGDLENALIGNEFVTVMIEYLVADDKIGFIKDVRNKYNLSLTEAKEVGDSIWDRFKESLDKAFLCHIDRMWYQIRGDRVRVDDQYNLSEDE